MTAGRRTKTFPVRATAVAVVVGMLGAIGVGAAAVLLAPDPGPEETEPSPAVTVEGGVAGAYARISADYHGTVDAVRDELEGERAPKRIAETLAYYEQLLTASVRARDALAALPAPSDLRPALGDLVTALDAQVVALQDLLSSAGDDNDAGVATAGQALLQANLAYHEARLEMERQLEECGEPCRG